MATLLGLSHELLHCVFTEVEPTDLAALSRTCHSLHAYIKGNRLLHKDLYLRRYDEPKLLDEPDWEELIHKTARLERILQSEDKEVKSENLGFVSEQVDHLLQTACTDVDESANVQLLSDYFADQDNIDVFLCSSSLFRTAGTKDQQAAPTQALQQASAKLHCLYGKPVDPVPSKRSSASYSMTAFFTLRRIDTGSPSSNTRAQNRGIPAHTVARSKVYDLREYTDGSIWGPFMSDGSQNVDWEKVEAIMLVLGFNLADFTERSDGRFPLLWDRPFDGVTPQSYVSPQISASDDSEMEESHSSIPKELTPSLDDLDPYGVTGTWMRVVCFLDYNDLYAFNFSNPELPAEQAREPIDTQEGNIHLEEIVRVTLHQTE